MFMSGNVLRYLLLKVETTVQDILWCASSCLCALRMLQLHDGRGPVYAQFLHVSRFCCFFFFQKKPEIQTGRKLEMCCGATLKADVCESRTAVCTAHCLSCSWVRCETLLLHSIDLVQKKELVGMKNS